MQKKYYKILMINKNKSIIWKFAKSRLQKSDFAIRIKFVIYEKKNNIWYDKRCKKKKVNSSINFYDIKD